MNALNINVLVLNKVWQPIHTCSVRRALKLLCLGHAQVVEAEGDAKYQTHDLGSWLAASTTAVDRVAGHVVCTVNRAIRVPKVILLALYDKLPAKEVKFTRSNVFLRDHYTCQYCCKIFAEPDLNLDHVTPRDKGGKTRWDNIVTSCFGCNTRKSNKLPHEVNMFPKTEPRAPLWRPLFGYRRKGRIDDSWESFLTS